MDGIAIQAGMVFSRGGGLDPDVIAFGVASGATDLNAINDLILYIKYEGLYSNFVIFPMKENQNAGTGSTVFSLGGLTSNNMTLFNSPVWGQSGLQFISNLSHHGSVDDFIPGGDLTILHKTNYTSSNSALLLGQYETSTNNRSWVIRRQFGNLEVQRSGDGTVTNNSFDSCNANGQPSAGSPVTLVAQYEEGLNFASGGVKLWSNKNNQTLALRAGGGLNTSRFNVSAKIGINTYFNVSSPVAAYSDQTITATAFISGVILTNTQRETITDFINAL